jgi:hypothetical protein
VVGEIGVERFVEYFGYVFYGWNIMISMEDVIKNVKRSFNYFAETF